MRRGHANSLWRRLWFLLALLSLGWRDYPIRAIEGRGAQGATLTAPPVAPVRPVEDEYFGVKVTDPYRYMENMKDPAVEAWFKGQNAYTRALLARIPGRDELLAKIKKLDESAPERVFDVRCLPTGRYFYQKRLASEDLARIYMRDRLSGEEKLLVDPATFGQSGGPHFAIDYYAPSLDGRYVAFGVSPAGSEDAVLHVLDTQTGKETGDVIDRAEMGSPAWLPDNHTFLYNRLQKLGPDAAPAGRYLKSRAFLHALGTDPDKDRGIFGFEVSPTVSVKPEDISFAATIPESSYVLGLVAHGDQSEFTLYAAPLEALAKPAIPWKKVCDVDDDVTGFAVREDDLYLQSHKDASRYKVLHTKLSNPDVARAEVVVPPGEAVVRNISAASDALYVQELDGGLGRLVRLPYAGGKPEQVPLPFDGDVFVASTDPRVPGALVQLSSWVKARLLYAYDPESKRLTDTKLQPIGPYDDPKDLGSVEVKVKSYDGTLVPLSIVYKNGLALDGSHPTLLVGYGAFGITEDPRFDPKWLAWFDQGGVYAVAHVRGGGEYGEDWHLAGKGLTKQNTWKDFIACGEYLIAHRYTDSAHLGGLGGSAGGITIGRSMTERPDLFAAVIDAVPVSDMVRFEFTPNGPPNIPEFGTVKTEDGFKGLYAMSAYHHVVDGTRYPGVMVTTGFNDPRVISWEPGKMAARLQAATSSGKPILLRVDYEAGHGIGSTKTQRQQELADEWSFLLWQFGTPGFQPGK
ncbi:MAG: prolyl oligopeptidase family serine peptidase [Terriglobia bacterium]